MKKVLSIDYGKARIGLAISDLTKKIAFPLTVVQSGKNEEQTMQNILLALKDKLCQIETIIIGLPLLMNGKEGEMAKEAKEFGSKIQSFFKLPVEYVDERLTSRGATSILKEMKLNRKKRTKQLDQTAAALMLQTYLDQKTV